MVTYTGSTDESTARRPQRLGRAALAAHACKGDPEAETANAARRGVTDLASLQSVLMDDASHVVQQYGRDMFAPITLDRSATLSAGEGSEVPPSL